MGGKWPYIVHGGSSPVLSLLASSSFPRLHAASGPRSSPSQHSARHVGAGRSRRTSFLHICRPVRARPVWPKKHLIFELEDPLRSLFDRPDSEVKHTAAAGDVNSEVRSTTQALASLFDDLSPRLLFRAQVYIEEGIPQSTIDTLCKMGHDARPATDFSRGTLGRGQVGFLLISSSASCAGTHPALTDLFGRAFPRSSKTSSTRGAVGGSGPLGPTSAETGEYRRQDAATFFHSVELSLMVSSSRS